MRVQGVCRALGAVVHFVQSTAKKVCAVHGKKNNSSPRNSATDENFARKRGRRRIGTEKIWQGP